MVKLAVFRVDADMKIGAGHAMRCLVLTNQLLEQGHQIIWITTSSLDMLRDLIGELPISIISINSNHDVRETVSFLKKLQVAPDWFIVDHYLWSENEEALVRPYTACILVIDDLANRKHDCDILLDQNFYVNMEKRYEHLVPLGCKLLLGPQYALLRDEFANPGFRPKGKGIDRVIVSFGGSDPTGETSKTIQAILKSPELRWRFDVIVGAFNPYINELRTLAKTDSRIWLQCNVKHMAKLMREADLAIGAGGISLWERIRMGLPSITIAVADNQRQVLEDISTLEVIFHLGWHKSVKVQDIKEAMLLLNANAERVRKMSEESQKLVGLEVTQPVLRAMLEVGQ